LSVASIFFASRLRFSFSFDQFFPEGDPDLEFYREFSKEFGTDDNFLLIALENQPDIFDSLFLAMHTAWPSTCDHPHSAAGYSPSPPCNCLSKLPSVFPSSPPYIYSNLPFIHKIKN